MVYWRKPKTTIALQDFLGLGDYYIKFLKNCGSISQPLTDLLKKDQFTWYPTATEALKLAISTNHALAIANFSKPSVIETYARRVGIGAVLLQDEKPQAYTSKALSHRKKASQPTKKNFGLSCMQ